jgi:hypothetical protein
MVILRVDKHYSQKLNTWLLDNYHQKENQIPDFDSSS